MWSWLAYQQKGQYKKIPNTRVYWLYLGCHGICCENYKHRKCVALNPLAASDGVARHGSSASSSSPSSCRPIRLFPALEFLLFYPSLDVASFQTTLISVLLAQGSNICVRQGYAARLFFLVVVETLEEAI